jgi:hypothetical protein
MLTLETLTNIEALLVSRSHPLWGEFMPLARIIAEVQHAKAALTQARVRPADTPHIPAPTDDVPVGDPASI